MKKYIIAFGLVAVLIGLGTAASHANLAVTPDHALYDTKISVEDQIEDLSANETEEVEAKLEHAEKRANETDLMVQENKTELANETANAYAEEMQEVNDLGEQVSDLAQQMKIDELVALATMHHAKVLGQVYERVPEEAKTAIGRAINASVKGHNKAVDAMERRGQPTDEIGNITAQIPKDVRQDVGTPSRGGQADNGSENAPDNAGQQNGNDSNGSQDTGNGQQP